MERASSVRALAAKDHEVVRLGLRALLDAETEIEVVDAVRKIARGEAVLTSKGIERAPAPARAGRIEPARAGSFSGLEIDILRSLSAGHSAREIARALHVSEETVGARVRGIKRRLGASDQAHAVVLAMKQGII